MSYLRNSQKTKIRVLGIDPGLRHTGWAVIEINSGTISYVASGVINTNSKKPLAERLGEIHKNLNTIILDHNTSSAAIEETYVNKNYSSSLKLAHARGAAMVTANACGVELTEYPAKTVKKTLVGNGSAPKDQVSRMLSIILPGVAIRNEDESDALAIAVCHGLHC
ncbi:MAG: crossover junction endodeoxyribonuclease RuvC [Candidatus Jidaibacter sp.]|jgi:crossover junction endodeoxyribonuclease RuvC|nr:crossover junction endodeoxyribonuclease RuvC [Candidatus Jidaibacter sp.]